MVGIALVSHKTMSNKVDRTKKLCMKWLAFFFSHAKHSVFLNVAPWWPAAAAAMALPPAFGLCVLPPELLLRVLRLLDAPALVALSAASRRLRGVAEDSTLWRHLYVRDFRGKRRRRRRGGGRLGCH